MKVERQGDLLLRVEISIVEMRQKGIEKKLKDFMNDLPSRCGIEVQATQDFDKATLIYLIRGVSGMAVLAVPEIDRAQLILDNLGKENTPADQALQGGSQAQ